MTSAPTAWQSVELQETLITDDYIGVTASGCKAGNGGNGVAISGSSSNDTVGGTTNDAGNLISANQAHGVELNGADRYSRAGKPDRHERGRDGPLGNGDSGVYLENGCRQQPDRRHHRGAATSLSGNDLRGVHITGGLPGNLVEGNFIGTNAAGKVPYRTTIAAC